MVYTQIDLTEEEDHKLQVYRIKNRLKNKEQAIKKIISDINIKIKG